MKQGWEQKTLGDVLDVLRNGANCKQDKKGIGDKISRIESISNAYFDIDKVGFTKLSKSDKEKYLLRKGDILFSHINSPIHVGKTALFNSDEEVYHGVNLLLMRPKPLLDGSYFEYYLKFLFQNGYWKRLCKQSVNQASVNQQDINKVEINYPKSLPEQQRIVAILDEAVAAIAKAKANAEQNLKNAREVFESYLNLIKTDKVDLGSLVDITTGKLNANAAVENGKYPFFTCSREVYAIDNYAFDLEAILLAGNNASGDFNVKHYKGKFNAYQRTYIITVNEKQKILNRYLYFQLLKSLKELKAMSVGANTRFLKLGMIQGLKIALPTIEVQQTIVIQLDVLRAETQKLEAIYQQKINDLEELKKSILQKAFSGELKQM